MWACIRSIRSSFTAIRLLLPALLLCSLPAGAQRLRDRYVSKPEPDGMIYHLLPCTLFVDAGGDDVTFDITYKEHRDGMATLNFTCCDADAAPLDSLTLCGAGSVTVAVERLYVEPERQRWRHRYTCRLPLDSLYRYLGEEQPGFVLRRGAGASSCRLRPSAWRSYAPAGRRIVELIRANER